MGTADDKQVCLVAYKLKEGAFAWWDRVQLNRTHKWKLLIWSWRRMKRLMANRLLPPNYQQELFRQYKDCKQGTRTVNEYMEEFDRLVNCNDLEETEDQRISRFVHGLRVSIWDQVSLQTLYTLNEAVTLSKKIEYQQLKASLKFSNCNSESSNSTTNKGKQPMFMPRSQLVVWENSGVNQSTMVIVGSVAQPIVNTNPYARLTRNKCYRCRESGHWLVLALSEP